LDGSSVPVRAVFSDLFPVFWRLVQRPLYARPDELDIYLKLDTRLALDQRLRQGARQAA
jgi:hypothetical protein